MSFPRKRRTTPFVEEPATYNIPPRDMVLCPRCGTPVLIPPKSRPKRFREIDRKGDLLVCTANYSGKRHQMAMLEESCRVYGLDFNYHEGDWQGFIISKTQGIVDFLSRVTHPYVLFTDAWDSWMLANEKTIMDIYHSFEKPIVVCGHEHIYPADGSIHAYNFPESPTRYRYTCPGQYMGETGVLLETIRYMLETYTQYSNDQSLWNKGIASGDITEVVEIDYHCKLFLEMTGMALSHLSFDSERRVVFDETGSRPIGIHFGGPKGAAPNGQNMNSFYQTWVHNR